MICVTSVSVTPKSISINKNSWYYGISATVLPSNATYKTVTWSSSNTNVATVNASNGYVYGNAAGTATIYATATDGSGKWDSCTVTVLANVPVTSVAVCPSSVSMYIGGTTSLSATVYPSNATNKTLNWSTTDPCVATVNQSGVVTATGGGTATIYATATDGSGKHGSCTINVMIPVTSITLNTTEVNVMKNSTVQLVATAHPSYATNKTVSWSSQDDAIASVDQTGLVTGVEDGNTTIYASTFQNGVSVVASCLVHVQVQPTSVSLNKEEIFIPLGETATLIATVHPENAINKTVTWSSSNEYVVTVSGTGNGNSIGVIESKHYGSATISVYIGDSKTATCSITVGIDYEDELNNWLVNNEDTINDFLLNSNGIINGSFELKIEYLECLKSLIYASLNGLIINNIELFNDAETFYLFLKNSSVAKLATLNLHLILYPIWSVIHDVWETECPNLNNSYIFCQGYNGGNQEFINGNLYYSQNIDGSNLQNHSTFHWGISSFSGAGCEVAAVYNAMQLLGNTTETLKSVGHYFITSRDLVAFGLFGTDPFSLGSYFDSKSINYSTYSNYEDFKAAIMQSNIGTVGIISFFNYYGNKININNSIDFGGLSIHTIAFIKNTDVEVIWFNNYSDEIERSQEKIKIVDLFQQNQRYIIGYLFNS